MPLTNERSGGSFSKLKQMGQRFLRGESANAAAKPRPIPADVGAERRSGRRVALPLDVRIKVGTALVRFVRLRDVNLPGLSITPADGVEVGDHVSVGFDGCAEVTPPFALVAVARRILPSKNTGEPSAVGLEIDRELSSADAQKNYRRVVRHYLHHRPLLEDLSKGYFEGRCTSCDWVGRVGKRSPQCSRCRGKVVALSGHVYSSRT